MMNRKKEMEEQLGFLKLPFMLEQYRNLAAEAANKNWGHQQYLQNLVQGEADRRWDNSIQRRIRMARFPVPKSLDQFQWTWPKKINRQQLQQLFMLDFIEQKANGILLGGVGLGKTHLATALGYQACLKGYSVLFATAVDVINTLTAAQAAGQLKNVLKTYLRPSWILELDMDVIRNHASTFGMDAGELTASWVFDRGYVTWAGITPDDTITRNREREEIQELAKTDLLAYIKAMKEWGINREKRFIGEGWRKMQ